MLHAPHLSRNRRRGFTLTELLVVIGIIVLLSALAVPMILRAYRQGSKVRTKADLNTISIALNAYKQDFGDYPRVDGANIGPAILGKALVGPYGDGLDQNSNPQDPPLDMQDPPVGTAIGEIKAGHCARDTGGWVALVDGPSTDYADPLLWAKFDAIDGADGPGFRTRKISITGAAAPYKVEGKVYGPYLQAENFKMVGTFLYDRDGAPILYFPANLRATNIRANFGTFSGYVDKAEQSMYDARDNIRFFRRDNESDDTLAMKRLRSMLGDHNPNNPSAPNSMDGKIDGPNEKPVTEAPFILWTAGPDGQFGPIGGATTDWPTKRDLERCDDITSFTP